MNARRVDARTDTVHGDVRVKSERAVVWYRPTQPKVALVRRARHAIEMRDRRMRQRAR